MCGSATRSGPSPPRWILASTGTCTATAASGWCCRPVDPRSATGPSPACRTPTEDADESAPELTPHELPDDVLVYTMPSRFCLPDMLGNEAWSQVQPAADRATAGCRRSASTSTDHLQFAYGSSSPDLDRGRRQRVRVRGLPGFHPPGDHLLPGDEHPGPVRLRLPAGHGRAVRPGADGLRRLDGGVAGRPVVDLRPAEQRRRKGRILIGRGRDASDVAMVTSFGGPTLQSMSVVAIEMGG